MARVEQSYNEHTKSIGADGIYLSAELPYLVFDASDEDDALSAALAQAPHTCGNLVLDSLEISEKCGDSTFRVNAIYKTSDQSGAENEEKESDESVVSFDCSGGTKHMNYALNETVVKGANAGGAIGWNGKTGAEMSIAGVDVPTAQLRETYTRTMRLAEITTAYKKKVAALVGKVNASAWKGWEAGEVMFLGMSYSSPDIGSTEVLITYNFAIQPNEKDVDICGTKISKKGYEYVWVLSESKVNAQNVPELNVTGIYIDKVCETDNFEKLGL